MIPHLDIMLTSQQKLKMRSFLFSYEEKINEINKTQFAKRFIILYLEFLFLLFSILNYTLNIH